MEPTTGVEPVDLFLTKEALYQLSYVGDCSLKYAKRDRFALTTNTKRYGAGDESRTRDIQLGRLMLYQLSYSRHKNSTPHDSRDATGQQAHDSTSLRITKASHSISLREVV
jgi:hypothetical protein